MILLKIILIPVSFLYSVVIFLRNKFYEFGIFKTTELSKPVVSIGNITTGGTGKTPLVIFTAEYYLKKGLKVGIISRGYNRKSGETVIVCDGKNINTNPEESGDELIMIANELEKNFKGNFFIAADKDRIKVAKLLIEKFNVDIIILDDGYQHRKIHRDVNIAVIDAADHYNNVMNNLFLIPSGNLRESHSNLERADIIIQNNKTSKLEIIPFLSERYRNIILMRYKTEYFIDIKNIILSKTENSYPDAVLFSGIANDDSFLKLIKNEGINIIKNIKYSDHYNYEEPDIDFLKSQYKENSVFITTEKDFVKVKNFEKFIFKYPVYFLKLKIEFTENYEFFCKKLDDAIK